MNPRSMLFWGVCAVLAPAGLTWAQDAPADRADERPSAVAPQRDAAPADERTARDPERRAQRLRSERRTPLEAEDRPPGERPGPPRGDDLPPGPEDIQTILQILRHQNPVLADRIHEALEKDPQRVRELLAAQLPRLSRLVELRRKDPQLFELTMREIQLNRQAMELARTLRERRLSGPPAELQRLRDELRQRLAEQFEARQAMRQRELDNLQRRVQEIRRDIDQRADERDRLIDQRLDELIAPRGTTHFHPDF